MKNIACRIPLTQQQFALVSPEDYEFLMQFKWLAMRDRTSYGYRWRASRCLWPEQRHLYMHREVARRAGLPESRYYDHKDRNGLNNRRDNLRPCTNSQNAANQSKRSGLSSKYKGVMWDKVNHKWESRIKVCGIKIFLGRFNDELDAFRVYAAAAHYHFGEFACVS